MYSFRHTNPELAGTIMKERVCCGHENCYCSKGERFHEASYLYYRDYRDGGRLRKKYVPKNKVEKLTSEIERAKREDKEEKLNAAAAWAELRQLIKGI